MNGFVCALEQRNPEELRKYPKADLHNHFVLGGSRRFLYQVTGKKIEPLADALSSMDEMDQWSQKYIGQDFNSTGMRKLLIKAAFQQAREDGVTVLEIGEDVWGFVGEEYRGNRLSQQLIRYAIDYIKNIGYNKMYIVSDHENLYEKYGFRVIDRKTAPWGSEEKIYIQKF